MPNVVTIGKRLIPLDQIAFVEPFDPTCSATIWMGRRRRSGMHFDGRGRLMIVAARQDCKLYFVGT